MPVSAKKVNGFHFMPPSLSAWIGQTIPNYGYQTDPTVLLEETMPKVAAGMKSEGVEAVFLTPA